MGKRKKRVLHLSAVGVGLQRAHKRGFRRGLFVGFVVGVLIHSMMGCAL